MNVFQKDMQVSLLLDFYGDILSERRRDVTGLYYNDDLSLAEIAEITGISRQGVRDAVRRSVEELYSLEEKLGLVKRFSILRNEIAVISSQLTELSIVDPALAGSLNNIAKRLSELNI